MTASRLLGCNYNDESSSSERHMVMTVPNPRRTPSRQISDDATTLHGKNAHKRRKVAHTHDADLTREDAKTVDSLKPTLESQASGSSDQSASKWFDHANKHVVLGDQQTSNLDNDSPFYMSNRVHYVPSSYAAPLNDRRFGGGVSRMDSENEDLRGVIDDLTIENKKLKQVLRSQYKQQRGGTGDDSQQQQDKLFEVRMHGLHPEKRRELEYLLKNFAQSVHNSVPPKVHANSTSASNDSSAQGSNVPNVVRADSGYASMSNSGATSIRKSSLSAPKQSTSRAVKSYLHDIPDTLLPRHSPLVMSERTKMALVVRRLEQLFIGRKAGPGDHSQPMQQQEVSHLAARADQGKTGKEMPKKRTEGTREAHVMPPDTKINLDAVDDADASTNEHKNSSKLNADLCPPAISRTGSPDQRPTRPLDLDIYRAQIASENIQYIRHLGLASPRLQSKDSTGDSWIFLNLLMNMAQLHTINVTPDFVRKAIRKLSKCFELSSDGYKVRWTGESDGTKFPAEDERILESTELVHQDVGDDGLNASGGSKRSRSNSTSNAAMMSNVDSQDKMSGMQTSNISGQRQQLTTSGTSNPQISLGTKPTTVSSAFDYKPVVYRGSGNRGDDYDCEVKDSDDSFDSNSGDSSGLVHALSRSNLKQKSQDEGLITFYNNPYFCSDFSADNVPSNMKPSRIVVAGETLGIPPPTDLFESPLRHHDATYFTTQFARRPYQPESADDPNLYFKLPNLTPISEAGESEIVPVDFEVCGLGGVTPEDNLAIDVTTVLAPTRSGERSAIRRLPFSRRSYSMRYKGYITSAQTIRLLPSKLPPPSYIFFTSSSSSDSPGSDSSVSSEDSDSSSSPLVDEEFPAPPMFLAQFSGNSGDSLADDEDDKDSSIDMLAMARKMAPEQVAEQERVYMITQPGGDRAVAGSLAATVGASESLDSFRGKRSRPANVSEGEGNEDDNDDDAESEMEEEGSLDEGDDDDMGM